MTLLMVHLLSYERLDLYKEVVRRMTAMADCLGDHTHCKNFRAACSEIVCLPSEDQLQQSEGPGPQEVHDRAPTHNVLPEGELEQLEQHVEAGEGVGSAMD